MRNFLHIFLLTAFVLSGISPACKFISGETTLMEICGAFGMKTVEVPADQTDSAKHLKTEDCAFCFAQTHIAGAQAKVFILTPPAIDKATLTSLSYDLASVQAEPYQARGPPILNS